MKTQVVDNTRSFVAHTVEAVSANAFTGKPNRACDAIYAVEFQRCQVKTFSDFLYHALIAGRTLYGVFFQDFRCRVFSLKILYDTTGDQLHLAFGIGEVYEPAWIDKRRTAYAHMHLSGTGVAYVFHVVAELCAAHD